MGVKSINLHTIRKLIEYSLKNVFVKAMFTLTVLTLLVPEKLKSSIFEIPIIPQSLSINN